MKKRFTIECRKMEKWSRSVALIRKVEDGRNAWLSRVVSSGSTRINFISTPRLGREPFRESIRREVAWVLDLDKRRDILVSNMVQLNLEFAVCHPNSESESRIAVAFFLIDIFRTAVLSRVSNDPSNLWLSSREVCRGRSDEGLEIDPRTLFLLDRANVISEKD